MIQLIRNKYFSQLACLSNLLSLYHLKFGNNYIFEAFFLQGKSILLTAKLFLHTILYISLFFIFFEVEFF